MSIKIVAFSQEQAQLKIQEEGERFKYLVRICVTAKAAFTIVGKFVDC
jgi:hypothetical protein